MKKLVTLLLLCPLFGFSQPLTRGGMEEQYNKETSDTVSVMLLIVDTPKKAFWTPGFEMRRRISNAHIKYLFPSKQPVPKTWTVLRCILSTKNQN